MRELPGRRREDAGYGMVEIVHCFSSCFGAPGDEEIEREPLFEKGLRAYGVFEIVNSEWKKRSGGPGRFPGSPRAAQRHFAFTFHDSTFQCIATGLRGMTIPRPFDNVLAEVRKRW